MSTKFLSIFDDNLFIRVFDSQKSTTVYFNKVGLTISNDNTKEFYIQSNNHIGYYKFENVAYPYAVSISKLVETLVSWLKTGVDDEWDLSTATPVLEIKMDADDNPLKMNTFLSNGSVTSFNSTKKTVEMIITNGSRVQRLSKQYIPLRLGQDYLAVLSGVLVVPTLVTTHIGMYNTENFRLFLYSANNSVFVDLAIPGQFEGILRVGRSAWNIDKVDGSGPSGVVIDFTKFQHYVFEMKYRHSLACKVGVLYNNNIIWFHDFSEYNALMPLKAITRYVTLFWDIWGGSGTHKIEQGYSIVYSRQQQSSTDVSTYSTNTIQAKVLNASDTNKNVLSITLQPVYNRSVIRLSKIKFKNTQIGYARWDLVLSPTTVDGSSSPLLNQFVDIPRSRAMKSETDVEISGGIVLASGYISSNSINEIDLGEDIQPILTTVLGDADKISIRLSGMYGTSAIFTSLSWKEYY